MPLHFAKYSGSSLIRIDCEFRWVRDPRIIEYEQSARDQPVSDDFILINAHCVSTRTSLAEVLYLIVRNMASSCKPVKRKHVVLSLETKLTILDRLLKGDSQIIISSNTFWVSHIQQFHISSFVSVPFGLDK